MSRQPRIPIPQRSLHLNAESFHPGNHHGVSIYSGTGVPYIAPNPISHRHIHRHCNLRIRRDPIQRSRRDSHALCRRARIRTPGHDAIPHVGFEIPPCRVAHVPRPKLYLLVASGLVHVRVPNNGAGGHACAGGRVPCPVRDRSGHGLRGQPDLIFHHQADVILDPQNSGHGKERGGSYILSGVFVGARYVCVVHWV